MDHVAFDRLIGKVHNAWVAGSRKWNYSFPNYDCFGFRRYGQKRGLECETIVSPEEIDRMTPEEINALGERAAITQMLALGVE